MLTSRVVWRPVVSNWTNGNEVQDPDDLLNDVIEGVMGSLENFRRAVAGKEPLSYLGPSDHDLVWCTPSEDIDKRRAEGITGPDLIKALGLKEIGEDAIEIIYSAPAVRYYKPTAIHAGANPEFRPAPVDSEFGQTIGGLREAVHLPVDVIKILDSGPHFRLWEMPHDQS